MTPGSDGTGGEDTERVGSPCCKVQRTAAAFDVVDALDDLVTARRAGTSFRELATQFNTRVVEQALGRADVDGRSVHAALTGEDIAGDVYEVLRTDRDSDIRRPELRARLSDAGVDVDALESAFVSHVTVRSHLQECVGVEPEQSPAPFEQTVNTAQGARTRASNVIQSTVDRAVRNGQLQTGTLDAEVLVRLTCQDCGTTFYLSELLEQRRCACESGRE
jgi:uncharacterized membrane protein